jgi:hypothetical protein
VAELAANPGFRQKLRLIFYGTESRQSDRDNMLNWVINKNTQFSSKVLWFASYFAPAITIGTIIAAIAGSIGPELPGLLFLGQLFFVGIFGKQTMRIQRDITQQYDVIRKYSEFLKLIESEPFTSPLLVNIRESLQNEGHEPPSKIIGSLAKLLNWLDSNLNLLVSILLNGLFMFNLHILFGIERWKNRNAGQIEKWFQAMASIDAFASLGNFSFNNPGFIFPEPVEGTFSFTASDFGHPLIEPGKCVTNNIQIGGWNQFCIITGANMSGKSTFLRTLGTNLVLAMAGAPVYASRMQFSPIQIHSSIRTSDSLAKKESYFYAELKRLKEIITGLQAGEVKLILIDEVLKGTNSRDKQSGSIALIRQLLKYKSVGMFATHDLILGELQQEYPENVQNLCFEINIEGEEMVIDYKIRPGVCKNLNATFLMRQMGIIKE